MLDTMELPVSARASSSRGKKRKKNGEDVEPIEELEINLLAPEPASKRALRKAKRAKATSSPEVHGYSATDLGKPGKGGEISQTQEHCKRSRHGVWIGNLPFFVTTKDLQAFLTSDYENTISLSQITRIHLPHGAPKPNSHFQNKGFAYVDLMSAEAVQIALQLSEKLLGGRRVLIKSSDNFEGRPQCMSKNSVMPKAPSKRVFVGNLEFDVTKEDLEQHFTKCGPIDSIQVATFEDSGKCKGYAWVQFEHLPSAQAAMRGWIEVDQDSFETRGEGGRPRAKYSNKAKRRIWTKIMNGRKLRTEFAEDKVTRYRKRFGKEIRSNEVETPETILAGVPKSTGQNQSSKTLKSATTEGRIKKPRAVDASSNHLSGYSVVSVQKMTGAITEGQGSKITFD